MRDKRRTFFFGLILLSFLTVQNIFASDPTLIFPQLAEGSGSRFEVNITNPGYFLDDGTISFKSSDGTDLMVSINGELKSSLEYSISAGGSIRFKSDGTSETLLVGYALVHSNIENSKITGSITYTLGNREISVASSPLSDSYHVFVERRGETNSGIAFANPGDSAIKVRVVLFDEGGIWKEEVVIDLTPGQHDPRFITEFFENVPDDFNGSVHARSRNEFTMVGFRMKPNGSLAMLSGSPSARNTISPASKLPPEEPFQTGSLANVSMIFPQVANGNGTLSEFILTNPSSSATNGSIDLKDQSGAPWIVSIGGIEVSSIPFSLRPGGVFKVKSDGTGTLKVGYALVKLNSHNLELTGTVIYELSGYEISVPSSPPTTEYHMFAELAGFAVDSGIAIANPGDSALSVDIYLVNAAGQKIAENTLDLLAGEHKAAFISQLFTGIPSIFTGTFQARALDWFSTVGLRLKDTGSLSSLSGSPITGPINIVSIGAEGGLLTSKDGTFQLQIPQGALTESTPMEIVPDRSEAPTFYYGFSLQRGWRLEPDGLVLKKSAAGNWSFGDIWSEPERLGLAHWDSLGKFAEVATAQTLDLENRNVEFQLNHFSHLGGMIIPSHTEGWAEMSFDWVLGVFNWYLDSESLTIGSYITDSNIEAALTQWQQETTGFSFNKVENKSEAQVVFREGTITAEALDLCTLHHSEPDSSAMICFDIIPNYWDNLKESNQVQITLDSATVRLLAESEANITAGDYAKKVLIHEVGHFLGLMHPWVEPSDGSESIMMSGISSDTSLHQWDVSALINRYGPLLDSSEKFYFSTAGDGRVSGGIYEVSNSSLIRHYQYPFGITGIAVSPSGVIHYIHQGAIFKLEGGQPVEIFKDTSFYPDDIEFDSQGRLYLSIAGGAALPAEIRRVNGSETELYYQVSLEDMDGFWAGPFAFDSNDDLWLASGNQMPSSVYKVTNGTPNSVFSVNHPISGLFIEPNGDIVISNYRYKSRGSRIHRADISNNYELTLIYESSLIWMVDVSPVP